MDLDQYQQAAGETRLPSAEGLTYSILGLVGEAGELANKTKKLIRDGKLDPEVMAAELGDVLWYVAAVATDLDYDLSEIAADNLHKLATRASKGTIQGEGDNR